MFYYVEPEVAGGFGASTLMDPAFHPPVVSQLEYQFEGWLGDELLETFPCFIVTEAVASEITKLGLTGFLLATVKITASAKFEDVEPKTILPAFFWLKVDGKAGFSDFGIAGDYRLVISERARCAFFKFKMQNADMEVYGG
ncbi:hypothetical protein H7698_19485 [Pseudomonas sp. p50]|nr:hypothetical protein [Pseudomonas sp. p50(2008)]